ncbi:hypothetical protein [Fischerella thermalis]|nr:hypothetical protein [Fischerella thermalis]
MKNFSCKPVGQRIHLMPHDGIRRCTTIPHGLSALITVINTLTRQ